MTEVAANVPDKVLTNVYIDEDIKAKAQELFADFGMDLSTAVNIFLRQAVRENAIPFSISREVPNVETLAAIREIAEMNQHSENYKKYASFAELVAEVMNDV